MRLVDSGGGGPVDVSLDRWPENVADVVGSALGSVRSGGSTTLVVVGEPGIGKTTLLDEVTAGADGFTVLSAEGVLGSVSPFMVLEQWGVQVPAGTTSFLAAQAVRERIDEIEGPDPDARVLLRLDDLQWADPESVDALVWLLRRASGDRLLALVGSRPLAPDQHPGWQRWIGSPSKVRTVRLSGLTEELALRLARRYHSSLPRESARTLWTHTGGNPLYLSALLSEHAAAELARMRVLPAPAEYERLVTDRLERLDPAALTVVRATAVLGTGWTTLPVLAEVAGIDGILDAADRGQAAGLLQLRVADGAPAVRLSHALARSAVYYGMALRDRRQLHLRAAAVSPDVELRLEHRVQASMSFDQELADELSTQAQLLHTRRSFRLAGQFLEWASAVTADRRERERLWLDALFEQQLSGQHDAVTKQLDELESHPDETRLLLLRGHAALLDGQPALASRLLRRAVDRPSDPDDRLPSARAHVLLASAHVRTGASADTILSDLQRAQEMGPTDPGLHFREFYCEGVARGRASSAEVILDRLSFLPDNVSEVPPELRDELGWRGLLRLVLGLFPEALVDLREAHARAASHDAVTDVVDGAQLAFIGVAHWMLGRWDRARVVFGLLEDIVPRPQALAQAYVCVLPATTGDFAAAERKLARVTDTLEQEPWQEGVQALFLARVVYAHAGESEEARRGLLDDMRRRWPHAFVDTGLVGPSWFMHGALAAIWAGELDLADEWTGRLEAATVATPWAPGAARWLRGLAAERSGRPQDAGTLLREATRLQVAELPFYRAHVLTDYARVAQQLGQTAEAARARSSAQELYRGLGAVSYLAGAPAAPGTPAASPVSSSAGLRDRFGLSEREEDVATLVADGMSYAQVARELYITRSTVGFHLGNIYAKVGVTSRHELRDLVRRPAVSA